MNTILTRHERNRLLAGCKGTGGNSNRVFATAKHAFLSGYSLDVSIERARSKYGY
jgi:hypothetical protein